MKSSTLISSVAVCFSLGVAAPLLAQPAATGAVTQQSSGEQNVSPAKVAETCLSDLRTFDSQMEKDGYWLSGSGFGHGYPLGGYGYYGYGHGYSIGSHSPGARYGHARLGYEIRTLVVAANVLARRGQQQPCQDLLVTTREIYKSYVADMRDGGMPMANVAGWRQQQITAALPVTSNTTSFRADQLLGTDVRNLQNEALGSVDDLVMSPQTGKIAYLVIARGGIFGIGEKYIPIPWEDFNATPNANLLVLDTTKVAMDAAPQVNRDQFTTPGEQSQKVDAYWKSKLTKR